MRLYKRGEVYWYDFSIKGSRFRNTTGTKNKKLAEEFATKIKHDIYNQVFLGKKKAPTWNEILNYYFDNRISKSSDNTKLSYLCTINSFKEAKINYNNPVLQDDIYIFCNYLRAEKKLKDTSIITRVSFIKAACLYAVKNQLLSINLSFNFDNFNQKSEAKKVLNPEQFKALCKVTKDELYKNIWILLLNTGCRIREILTLTKDRVFLNVEQPYFYLPASLVKTKKDRFVPLFEPAFSALQYIMQKSKNDNVVPYHYSAIIKHLKIACTTANLPQITPHNFRHMCITWASRGDLEFLNGVPMPQEHLQLMVGHSKGSKITAHYTHLEYKDIFNFVNKDKQ